ncbi:uncharacterized protein LOC111052228 [Nilaparvata lugens]|uniref:uncharacterized protein LOC111052228 n=1 Tax=Nilaparvata lugens TaxID=108931 RepID=UPI00193D1D03|nr:uncharacterized protein LOC111052228 [Nilaparvata lugens]
MESTIAGQAKENCQLREEINFLQQRSRIENIEITGVPQTDSENIYSVLGAVAKAIGVPYKDDDIAIAHRVPNTGGNFNIIVKFVARKIKIAWLEAAKKKRGINSSDLGLGLPKSAVYINEHLSPINKQLLGKAKELRKNGKLTYVWVKSGKIFVRKDAASLAKQIVRESSLKNFIQE